MFVSSFVSGDEIRAKNPTMKKPSMLTISRSSHYDPSKQVKYQITDDVTQLKTDDDWNRVVGVFVSGAAWQFGDWPKKKWANPAAIFENGHRCRITTQRIDYALMSSIEAAFTHSWSSSSSLLILLCLQFALSTFTSMMRLYIRIF